MGRNGKWQIGWLLALTGILCWCGCSESEKTSDKTEKNIMSVYCSVAPVADLAQKIGGAHVRVTPLIAPGRSAHDYSPSPSEIRSLQHAALYLQTTLPLERRILDKALAHTSVTVKNIAAQIKLRPLAADELAAEQAHENATESEKHEEHEVNEELFDQHIWLSFANLRILTDAICAAYQEKMPKAAEEFAANRERVLAELTALETQIRQELAPYGHAKFLVFHPAYGYFADEFGWEQVAIECEGKTPTPRQLSELSVKLRNTPMRVLFCQNQDSSLLVSQVAEVLHCQVTVLDPLSPDLYGIFTTLGRALAKSSTETVQP